MLYKKLPIIYIRYYCEPFRTEQVVTSEFFIKMKYTGIKRNVIPFHTTNSSLHFAFTLFRADPAKMTDLLTPV
jgi:hypothetical protein